MAEAQIFNSSVQKERLPVLAFPECLGLSNMMSLIGWCGPTLTPLIVSTCQERVFVLKLSPKLIKCCKCENINLKGFEKTLRSLTKTLKYSSMLPAFSFASQLSNALLVLVGNYKGDTQGFQFVACLLLPIKKC